MATLNPTTRPSFHSNQAVWVTDGELAFYATFVQYSSRGQALVRPEGGNSTHIVKVSRITAM